MSEKDVIEGMKTFSDWFGSYAGQSDESISKWKIPLECIPGTNKGRVILTLEEAKHVHDMYAHHYVKLSAPGKEFLASLRERIEQAETSKQST